MYYRITNVSFKPESRDAIFAQADNVRDQLAAIAGLSALHTVETGEGSMMLVAVYDSQANAEEGAKVAQQVLGTMAAHFTAMPTQSVGPVVWSL
ncbi:MAG: hypothetical protein CL927_14465 [Deltaproteobacteria bacterium]|nr:hypothetical protein [Deltaproteobacteria bacterium]HCH62192.1 hypothetical protein [Deltaproteobacteria bacterium]|tara:strand:- start:247 stop:528 length:282 start_codon:yes stop_codon:yes gene_type:complete